MSAHTCACGYTSKILTCLHARACIHMCMCARGGYVSGNVRNLGDDVVCLGNIPSLQTSSSDRCGMMPPCVRRVWGGYLYLMQCSSVASAKNLLCSHWVFSKMQSTLVQLCGCSWKEVMNALICFLCVSSLDVYMALTTCPQTSERTHQNNEIHKKRSSKRFQIRRGFAHSLKMLEAKANPQCILRTQSPQPAQPALSQRGTFTRSG